MFDGKYLKTLDNNADLFYDVGSIVYYTGFTLGIDNDVPGIVLEMIADEHDGDYTLYYIVLFGDRQEELKSDLLSY